MKNIKNLNIMNSYAEELHEISEKCPPHGFKKAEIILKNYPLAEALGFDKDYGDHTAQDALGLRSFMETLSSSDKEPAEPLGEAATTVRLQQLVVRSICIHLKNVFVI